MPEGGKPYPFGGSKKKADKKDDEKDDEKDKKKAPAKFESVDEFIDSLFERGMMTMSKKRKKR